MVNNMNAKALSKISKLALLDSVICFVGVTVLGILGWIHFLIVIIAVFTILCGVAIAVIAAALGHLVQKASKVKDENDLTI